MNKQTKASNGIPELIATLNRGLDRLNDLQPMRSISEIKQTDQNVVAEALLKTLNGLVVDEKRQEYSWQNKLADDLNYLNGRAVYFLETSCDESDIEAAQATISVIQRVVEAEELKRWKKKP